MNGRSRMEHVSKPALVDLLVHASSAARVVGQLDNRNGARLANIMISRREEGARFALIPADSAVPKGHPETRRPAE